MSKTIIITGASDGIGKALATQLSNEGNQVVIIGRSEIKTKQVANDLKVDYYIVDFTKLSEVRILAETLKQKYPTIDVLINNAGGMFSNKVITEDGFEKTLQVNHLAHFLLTGVLFDNLQRSSAIIINTSSLANNKFSKLDINDLNLNHKYNYLRAYGNAKLANVLFTREFEKRYRSSGIKIAAFHPGDVNTNFGNESVLMTLVKKFKISRKIMGMITPSEGADTAYYLATSNDTWQSGEYYYKRKITKAHKDGYNDSYAASLWTQSEQMVNYIYH